MQKVSDTFRIRKAEVGVAALCTLVIVGVVFSDRLREPLASAETRFVEVSPAGLHIVPASCPSTAHASGECSGPSSCNLTVSPSSISSGGQSVTLSWTAQNYEYCPSDWKSGASAQSGSGSCQSNPPISGNITATETRCYANIDPKSGQSQGETCITQTRGAGESYGSVDVPSGSTIDTTSSDAKGVVYYNLKVNYGMGNVSCRSWTTIGTQPSQPIPPQGPTCSAQYYCSGNDLYYRNAQCGESFVQNCAWGCAGGGCYPPPPPTGSIKATPSVVRSGNTSTISWTTEYTESCTVTEDNGEINDAWDGPNGTQTSSRLTQQTVYTLRCIGLDGSEFVDSAKVNIIPVWEEL